MKKRYTIINRCLFAIFFTALQIICCYTIKAQFKVGFQEMEHSNISKSAFAKEVIVSNSLHSMLQTETLLQEKVGLQTNAESTMMNVGTGLMMLTLNLLNTDGSIQVADGVFAEFDNYYSDDIDLDDALKFTNINENLGIVRNNIILAAERRSAAKANDTIYFIITKTTARSYQFVFDITGLEQPGVTAFLEDAYLNTSTAISLSGVSTINFTSDGTNTVAGSNRFRLVFKSAVVTPAPLFEYITATLEKKDVEIKWKVPNETGIYKYNIERSFNGINFYLVGSKTVNPEMPAGVYVYTDKKPVEGNNFYRIKVYHTAEDTNSYSKIVSIIYRKKNPNERIYLYPNPVFGNTIHLHFKNKEQGRYILTFFDVKGNVVYSTSVQHAGGNYTYLINPSPFFKNGLYRLTTKDENNEVDAAILIVR